MVSIIISAYNAETTIEKAITSCLNQTYKDIEIIVVNDCSIDNTENIILDIKDSRIKYFKNKVNRGCGYSRWRATKHIKGNYTIFLDADDYIKEDYIETLLNASTKYNSDLTCSGFITVKDGIEKEKFSTDKDIILEGINKYDSKIIKNRIYIFLVGALIKSSLWDKVEYNKSRYIEDSPTIVQLIWYANKRVYIPYVGYYYTQNDNSLIHTATHFKNTIYRCLCAITSIEFFKGKYEPFTDISNLKNIINEFNNIKLKKSEYKKYKKQFKYILDYYNKNK